MKPFPTIAELYALRERGELYGPDVPALLPALHALERVWLEARNARVAQRRLRYLHALLGQLLDVANTSRLNEAEGGSQAAST